jgi:hypothetical protein
MMAQYDVFQAFLTNDSGCRYYIGRCKESHTKEINFNPCLILY